MKIVATIACRNNSKRLYGKPLQFLKERTVLDYLVHILRQRNEIHDIVLAISEAPGNEAYIDYARSQNLKFVQGDDRDVLQRLIKACQLAQGTTVFRITSESPFPYLEGLPMAVARHQETGADYTTYSQLPDGCNFELIELKALEKSHQLGTSKHRSELCTLYINEHKEDFKIQVLEIPQAQRRPQYRLTIDYPEDLILCRKVVHFMGGDEAYFPYQNIIAFLDDHPLDRRPVEEIVEEGYVKPYY